MTEPDDILLIAREIYSGCYGVKRKEIVTMKKLNIKVKPEMLLTLGTVILGGAQFLLSTKKEANDKAQLKAEILKELTKEAVDK